MAYMVRKDDYGKLDILFSGIGNINGKRAEVNFRASDIDFDNSDIENPKIIISPVLDHNTETWINVNIDTKDIT